MSAASSKVIRTPLSQKVLNHLTYCIGREGVDVVKDQYDKPTNNDCIEHRNLPPSWSSPKIVMYVPPEIVSLYMSQFTINQRGKVSVTIQTGQFFAWAEIHGVGDLKIGSRVMMDCGNLLCINVEHMSIVDKNGNLTYHRDQEAESVLIASTGSATPLQQEKDQVLSLPRTTEVQCWTFQRRGQDLFRKKLMHHWRGRCPLTGLNDRGLLRASHIVPWADCTTNDQRLDVYNGLLLSPFWDAAFDRGLVTFSRDGWPLFSDSLSKTARAELRRHEKPIPLEDKHQAYLAWHRKEYGFPL